LPAMSQTRMNIGSAGFLLPAVVCLPQFRATLRKAAESAASASRARLSLTLV
jgi:hypothetical protein